MQTSWTAIFGAVAALESLVLAWGAQKFYRVWTRLFAAIVAIQWPFTIRRGSVESEDVPADAPKRPTRRQMAIGARDVCYNSIDAFSMS